MIGKVMFLLTQVVAWFVIGYAFGRRSMARDILAKMDEMNWPERSPDDPFPMARTPR